MPLLTWSAKGRSKRSRARNRRFAGDCSGKARGGTGGRARVARQQNGPAKMTILGPGPSAWRSAAPSSAVATKKAGAGCRPGRARRARRRGRARCRPRRRSRPVGEESALSASQLAVTASRSITRRADGPWQCCSRRLATVAGRIRGGASSGQGRRPPRVGTCSEGRRFERLPPRRPRRRRPSSRFALPDADVALRIERC